MFNCFGGTAQSLPGVQDYKCYRTRGQGVLVRAPQVRANVMRHGRDYETYVMPRPGSNRQVVLGGFMRRGNGCVVFRYRFDLNCLLTCGTGLCRDGSTYASDTNSIMHRARGLSAELAKGEPEVLTVSAGLRLSREGGARVEREKVEVLGKWCTLVHNYGAGGTGFQAGYGMATDAVDTVQDILLGISVVDNRARLWILIKIPWKLSIMYCAYVNVHA